MSPELVLLVFLATALKNTQSFQDDGGAAPGASRVARSASSEPPPVGPSEFAISIVPEAHSSARLAFERRILEFHRKHGGRIPHPLCGGCGEPIGARPRAPDLADGNRVHLADGYECLIRYGERWRAKALAAVTDAIGSVAKAFMSAT
jgi:hypothetical protein